LVLVDTSVWISLYRQKGSALGDYLAYLAAKNEAAVCGQIVVEFLGGFRKSAEFDRYRDNLSAFPFLPTLPDAYWRAAAWTARHRRISSGDAIIAATAHAADASLLTRDRAFLSLEDEGLRLDLRP
jgi:predicted nucleic acid-binding protein